MVGVGQAMEGTVGGGWGIEMIDKTVCNNASTKDVLHRSLICIIYRIAYNFGR